VITNSKELQSSIYTKLQLPGGSACVRLLTRKGIIGCSTPTSAPVTGPLLAVTAATTNDEIPLGSVAVVSQDQAGKFLQRCSLDISLQNTLAGVLLLHSTSFPGWNEAPLAPYPAYAVHEMDRGYPWNTAGLDLGMKEFPFPIFQLDNETSINALQRVEYNSQIGQSSRGSRGRGGRGGSTAVNVARMQLTMEATTNSSTCIGAKTCYPLGGYSIWAALPPLSPSLSAATATSDNKAAATKQLPIVLVLSQIDSTSLFHSLTQAADSPLSGLVVMMAAAQALGSVDNNNKNSNGDGDGVVLVENFQKRIVFLALMGEPWYFMGSRRLLWEIDNGSLAVQGLDLDNIEAIIEIGQVGRANRNSKGSTLDTQQEIKGNTTTTTNSVLSSTLSTTSAPPPPSQYYQLYGHVEKTGVAGIASAPLLAFLQDSAKNTNPIDSNTTNTNNLGVLVSAASSITPGLPPCSSSSFLRQRPSIPVVAIEEFDTAFINQAYHTQYDTINATDNIADDSVNLEKERFDQNGVAATAIFLANALNSLAQSSSSIAADNFSSSSNTSSIVPLRINTTAVEETVAALLDCLATESPGMGCPLVSALMTPLSTGPVGHYVGILRTVSQSKCCYNQKNNSLLMVPRTNNSMAVVFFSPFTDPSLPDPYVQTDVERFIWNFLAVSTATPPNTTSLPPLCSPNNASIACSPGTVCAGWRDLEGSAGSGRCINSTTRLVPSYSTLLECVGCNGTATNDGTYRWAVNMTSTAWAERYGWPEDPMWTESNWPTGTPFLELFLKESSSVDYAVLGAGLAVGVASVVVSGAVQMAWNKRLKQD
jgi:nicastrin